MRRTVRKLSIGAVSISGVIAPASRSDPAKTRIHRRHVGVTAAVEPHYPLAVQSEARKLHIAVDGRVRAFAGKRRRSEFERAVLHVKWKSGLGIGVGPSGERVLERAYVRGDLVLI